MEGDLVSKKVRRQGQADRNTYDDNIIKDILQY